MFIFITPRIIKNPTDLKAITMQKGEQIEEVIPDLESELFTEVNAEHAMSLCENGFESMMLGMNEQAMDYFKKALEYDSQNPFALYNLGVLYEEDGKIREAAASYQRVILTGTSLKAMEAEDPEKKGVSLLQLARERIERIGGG